MARGYTELLERPDREDVQKSPEIMKALGFKPGERVADIGPARAISRSRWPMPSGPAAA